MTFEKYQIKSPNVNYYSKGIPFKTKFIMLPTREMNFKERLNVTDWEIIHDVKAHTRRKVV